MTTTQPAALPELPEPAHRGPTGTGAYFNSYTADQMRAYALAALQPKPAEVSDADVWELWLRVCTESENLSTRVMIANFARAILALRPAQQSTPDDDEPCYCPTCDVEDGGTSCGMPNCGLVTGEQATPEPVGEPFGHVYRYVNDVQAARAEWPDKEPYWLWKFAMGAAPGTPGVEAEEINLYTHPAPAPQQVPMTAAQRMRLWQNTEKGKSATSLAAFERIVQITEAAHRIGITAQAKGGAA